MSPAGIWQQAAPSKSISSVQNTGSLTVQKDLSSFVDTAILSELIQLDLTNCLMSMSAEATGLGGFSDVFRGRARIAGRGNVDVAIKRLRFHVQTSDCKRVS